MKKLVTIAALTLIISACGASSVAYRVIVKPQALQRRELLLEAAKRVIEGRVTAQGKDLISQEMKEQDGNAVIAVKVQDAEAAEKLTSGLLTPFTMSIMKQVEEGQGDIISETFGEFKETGITTEHFAWVVAGESPDGKGSVVVQFTPEGKELLKKMFKANRGEVIGIFVRGQLMSKKLVDETDTHDSISIDGIPNPGLASAFADDVNVGLHVTFETVQ